MKRHKLARRGGFTLVEMMVVIAIIGILSAVVIVNIVGRRERAAAEVTPAIIKTVSHQVEMFKLDFNKYPETLNDLQVAPAWVDMKKYPPGGYLTDPPMDGWHNALIYRIPGTEGYPYDIISLGADGKDGGEGFDSDLSNHSRKQ